MSEPFLAQIEILPYTFAPKGWALCNGQLLPISQNTALFSLLGTTYGGDGKSTFALPNLQARAPLHEGQGPGLSLRSLGEEGGEETVTLIATEIPGHTHTVVGSSIAADQLSPAANVWAVTASRRATVNMYSATPGSSAVMNPLAFSTAGGSLPHDNMPPYLGLNFCIALQGVFPARN